MGVALYQLKMLKLIVVLAMAAFVFAAGDAEWLADKANEDGVITLPSGLMYKVVNSGDESGASPGPRTPCDVHYAGRLIDGTEFDSSYKRGKPATLAPNEVIKGWTDSSVDEGGRQVGALHPCGPRLRTDAAWTSYLPG